MEAPARPRRAPLPASEPWPDPYYGAGFGGRVCRNMMVFARFATVFLALSGLDILSTWIGGESGRLREANPLLTTSYGGLNETLLFTLNPAAAVLFASLIAWLGSGEIGRASAFARVTPLVLRHALAQSRRASRPAVRRAQLLADLYIGLTIFVFPVLNNVAQLALPPGLFGEWRTILVATVSLLGSLAIAHGAVGPLLAWGVGGRSSPSRA